MSYRTLHGRLHTIPDIDMGRIADNPSVLAGYTPPDQTATRPWYFGGANQRMYLPSGALEQVGARGSYLVYGKSEKLSPYVRGTGGWHCKGKRCFVG
jgi:hypothetical protein